MANTVPVLAAAVSVAGALTTVALGAVAERRRNRTQLRHLAGRYSLPLLEAAYLLRSRLGNADIEQLKEFGPNAPQRLRDYARYETVYRFGRYLCLVQIVFREVNFLDFGRRRHNRQLIERLSAVHEALSNRTLGRFLILGGEQRAIGDLLIDPDSPEGGPPRCLTYPDFYARIQDDARFARWFGPLLDDIDALLTEPTIPARLAHGTAALDELIGFLDRRKVTRAWLD